MNQLTACRPHGLQRERRGISRYCLKSGRVEVLCLPRVDCCLQLTREISANDLLCAFPTTPLASSSIISCSGHLPLSLVLEKHVLEECYGFGKYPIFCLHIPVADDEECFNSVKSRCVHLSYLPFFV